MKQRTCPETTAIEQFVAHPERFDHSEVEAHVVSCRLCLHRIEIRSSGPRVLSADMGALKLRFRDVRLRGSCVEIERAIRMTPQMATDLALHRTSLSGLILRHLKSKSDGQNGSARESPRFREDLIQDWATWRIITRPMTAGSWIDMTRPIGISPDITPV
jgi:hypothetical protein